MRVLKSLLTLKDATISEETQSPISKAVSQGLTAARLNLKPAIALWVFGVTVIVCYFFVPTVTSGLNWLSEFKSGSGIGFAFVSTAIFGGLLPLVIPRLFVKHSSKLTIAYLVSNLIFWGLKGVEVDLFYIFQSWMFGNEANVSTVASKVAFDQFIYVPIFGGLNAVLFYIWRDADYSLEKFRDNLGSNWYWNKVLPVLISNWFVWIPSCSLLYLLPLGLQLPIQNLILCFWVLIVAFMTEKNENHSAEDLESKNKSDSNSI